jgi:uncharacterized protein YaaN involved in tellurite resistance
MSGEEMERAIEFLVRAKAELDASIAALTQHVTALTGETASLTERLRSLTDDMTPPSGRGTPRTAETGYLGRELRERFKDLMISDEVTRQLTAQIANLASRCS